MSNKFCKGFTLFEFLMTMLIIAAIVTMSIFYEGYGYQVAKAESAIEELRQLIVYAQLEAIKKNTFITLCSLDAHHQCQYTWQADVAVFTDTQKQHRLADTNTLLKSIRLNVANHARLIFRGFGSSHYLTMDKLAFSGEQNGTFIYCLQYGDQLILRGLTISKTGRIRFLQQEDPYFEEMNNC